jgi:hypothetical protein
MGSYGGTEISPTDIFAPGAKQLFSGAPKVKGYEMSPEARKYEKEALARQNAIATGQNSITDLQYKTALDDLNKNQSSMAASARGVSNPGLMARNVMTQTQQNGMDIARESAAAKLAEQRGADQLIFGQAAAQRGVALNQANINQQAEQAYRNQNMQIVSNIGAAGATAASDENLKKDIKDGGHDATKVISEFMDALKSYTYEYKDKASNGRKNPEGEVTSVMAQDLEKSSVGKRAVKEGLDGKEVDYAQLMAPMLASMAELNKRLKKVEG